MSVKGRTYPFRVVIHPHPRDGGHLKPSTHVVQGDRDSAENRAAEVQARGTRAEVVLVQGNVRTAVTEYPAADFDPDFDPDGCSYFVRYHLPVTTDGATAVEHGTVTAEASQSLFESDARRAARAFQRAGGSAEIVRGNTVSSVYPALTGQALAGVAEPTTDERLDARITTPRAPRVIFERVRHAADCVSLNLTLLCDLEPRTTDANGVMTGSCLTGPADALAAEEERTERALDAQRLAELETEGPLSRQLRTLAPVALPVRRCPKCAMRVKEFTPNSTPEVTCPAIDCDWTGSVDQLDTNHGNTKPPGTIDTDDTGAVAQRIAELLGADVHVPTPPADDLAERRARYDRDMNRAADDAADALGGELGRAMALLLRHAGKHATQGVLDGMLALRMRRVGELVTERAIAARNTPRGGNSRRDLDRVALDAYSDRFEESRHEVRDHQAAMHDAIDAVFDAVGRGEQRVLLRPDGWFAAIPRTGYDRDELYPWRGTDGSNWTDDQVTGWWEMAPTGRVFAPETPAEPTGPAAEHHEHEENDTMPSTSNPRRRPGTTPTRRPSGGGGSPAESDSVIYVEPTPAPEPAPASDSGSSSSD